MSSSNQKIYIYCPANLRSGGPEALHQLCFYMVKVGLDAYMVYYNTTDGIEPMPPIYSIYGVKRKPFSEIEDSPTNILVAAESSTIMLNGFKRIQKYIWWLSVNWLDYEPASGKVLLKYKIKKLLGVKNPPLNGCDFKLNDCVNVCGSKYAFEYVQCIGIKNPRYLVEPISKQFLDANIDLDVERDDVVLYNPAKSSEIMNLLLEDGTFKFKALTKMTPDELIEAYKKAKLYIDFGHFGGPERMPKEAVYFGCSILVGNRNAAVNDFDVAIPAKYKISNYEDLAVVKNAIQDMLNDYEKNRDDFFPFKKKISKLESNFMKQIEELFIK